MSELKLLIQLEKFQILDEMKHIKSKITVNELSEMTGIDVSKYWRKLEEEGYLESVVIQNNIFLKKTDEKPLGFVYNNKGVHIGFTKDKFQELFPNINDFLNSTYWADVKIQRLEIDNYRCQLKYKECLIAGNTIHHLNSPTFYPKRCLDLKNLRTVCQNCHKKYHNIRRV